MAGRDLSPALLTLAADLAQQVQTAPCAGSVYRRNRDGKTYLYAKIPVGGERVDTFIGKAGDAIAEAQAASLTNGMELAKQRRRTVSMLRSAGLAGPERLLGAVLDAIAHAGLFHNGAVLVGTSAYMLSEPFVGRSLPAPTLMTGDLGLAMVNVALSAEPPEPMQGILRRADPSFEPVLQLDPRKPPVRFRNDRGFLVDLLAQTRRRDQSPVPLPALEAGAEPLQHLGWLIEAPLSAVALWGAGVGVRIPQPARLAAHKLIVAQRRSAVDRLKRQKDLAQADALMTALYVHDPFALEDALDDARAQGRAWASAIDRSLAELGRKGRS